MHGCIQQAGAEQNDGKSGHDPPCENFSRHGVCPKALGTKQKCKDCPDRAWTRLEVQHIIAHLRGEKSDASDVIGVYPLFPDGICRFLMSDFDHHTSGAEMPDGANPEDKWHMDNSIVWYGSINLPSKEDVEDNIMRVEDKNIAAELLETTFRKGGAAEEFALPLLTADV